MLRLLRWTSLTDGISFLVLLGIAMPLKYLAGEPLAVSIVGGLHGAIWTLLLVLLVLAWRQRRLAFGTAFLVLICSLIPAAPFLIDRRLRQMAAAGGTAKAEQLSTFDREGG